MQNDKHNNHSNYYSNYYSSNCCCYQPQAALFGAIGVVVLIALLIAKELLSASENDKAQLLGRLTSVAINPLLFAFLTIVIVKVVEVL